MEHVFIGLLATAFLSLLISRIHFHFGFTLTISRSPKTTRKGNMSREPEAKRRATTSEAPAVRSIQDRGVTKALETASASIEADLTSALQNLGCDRKKAQQLAKLAMVHASDFDGRLKWAIWMAA